LSGAANAPKTGDACNTVNNSEVINLTLEKEVVDMKQTTATTTVHKTLSTVKLSVAGLLVALIPKEYLANTFAAIVCQ
jgi:hypothetical protein